jgi:hypothetical protein
MGVLKKKLCYFLKEAKICPSSIIYGKIRALPITSMSLGYPSHKINTIVLIYTATTFPVYKHES